MKCGISTSYSRVSQSHEAGEGVGVPGAALLADLLGHGVAVGPHRSSRAVGEAGPVGRVEPVQREEVVHPKPADGEGLGRAGAAS